MLSQVFHVLKVSRWQGKVEDKGVEVDMNLKMTLLPTCHSTETRLNSAERNWFHNIPP